MCNYLGTESSPRSDFSGLQRTVMTELRPRSHDAVTCVELKEHKHTSGTWTQQKYLTVASSFSFFFLPVEEIDVGNILWVFREKIWFGTDTIENGVYCRSWKNKGERDQGGFYQLIITKLHDAIQPAPIWVIQPN